MKKEVTIKDIASKLNMSVSTVSKALNEDEFISVMTRERVKKLASEWNYIPNEAARHFKQNKTFTLGLIIPDMLDQFYVMAINGAEKIAAEEKYNVIISQSHEDPFNEEKIVDLMKRNCVGRNNYCYHHNHKGYISISKIGKYWYFCGILRPATKG